MNRKATAVELRYAPTGTIVWCQDKRTPEQNYELALLNLRKGPENPDFPSYGFCFQKDAGFRFRFRFRLRFSCQLKLIKMLVYIRVNLLA